MNARIDFYFDFSSPYGYLASRLIEDLAARHGRTVDWHPILLGVVFKETGGAPLTEIPLKGAYAKVDFERSARYHGIQGFRLPARFPIASQAPARIVVWGKARDPALGARLAKALYRAYFEAGRDISDPEVAADVAAGEAADRAAARAAVDDPAIKDALRDEVARAIKAGVFGSPFVIADGEPFWGLDRFEQIERHLVAHAPGTGRVQAVSHVRLIVPDLAAAVAFYRDTIGLALRVDIPQTYAEFSTGGARLALCSEAVMGSVVGRSPPRAGDAQVICLRVDDVDAAAARLRAQGVTFVREPHDQPTWYQRVAHLRDPAGNLVELWAPLPPR